MSYSPSKRDATSLARLFMSSCGNEFLLVATNHPFLSPSTAASPSELSLVSPASMSVKPARTYLLALQLAAYPSNHGLFLYLMVKAPAIETPCRLLLRILPSLATLALLPPRLLLSFSLLESLGDTGTTLASTMCLGGRKNPSLWY